MRAKTLAASGIGDFQQHSETASYTLKRNEYHAPTRCTLGIEGVGDNALYLLSDLSGVSLPVQSRLR